MPTFELQRILSINGRQLFFQLLIDKVSQYETFYKNIQENKQYCSELLTILANMDYVANLNSLAKEKLKDITPKKEKFKEYEFKTKHLRVYTFHIPSNGKIVAVWGLKTTQVNDIREFRRIKKLYLESLK